MNTCQETHDNDCKIDCPPMDQPAKRSITDETDDATKKISLGPFVLAPELDSDDQLVCNKEELGCSHMCGIDTTGVAYCYCPQGFVFMNDGITCLEINRKSSLKI
uniref:Uromodulin-like n=1 Tax=Phallusia mammillata TaxID=59560 RepID=A0A6F9DVN5_9ASCI|nr:uromodulin-like [Phallusia mammillata]